MTKGVVWSLIRVVVTLPITCYAILHQPTKVDAYCANSCDVSCTGEGENEVCWAQCVGSGDAELCQEINQSEPSAGCWFEQPMCS